MSIDIGNQPGRKITENNIKYYFLHYPQKQRVRIIGGIVFNDHNIDLQKFRH